MFRSWYGRIALSFVKGFVSGIIIAGAGLQAFPDSVSAAKALGFALIVAGLQGGFKAAQIVVES